MAEERWAGKKADLCFILLVVGSMIDASHNGRSIGHSRLSYDNEMYYNNKLGVRLYVGLGAKRHGARDD
jgi:hypothetical protein